MSIGMISIQKKKIHIGKMIKILKIDLKGVGVVAPSPNLPLHLPRYRLPY